MPPLEPKPPDPRAAPHRAFKKVPVDHLGSMPGNKVMVRRLVKNPPRCGKRCDTAPPWSYTADMSPGFSTEETKLLYSVSILEDKDSPSIVSPFSAERLDCVLQSVNKSKSLPALL